MSISSNLLSRSDRTAMRKIACYFLLFVASGWSAEAAEICLRSEVICSGPLVRLADVAELDADNSELAAIPLFPAPATGKPRLVQRQEIEQLLHLSDVPLRDCRVTGAESVFVHSGREVIAKTIRRPAYQIVPAAANVVRETTRPQPSVQPATATTPIPPDTAATPVRPAPAAVVAPEKLVARGQGITVRAVAPGVRITSPGKALADGALGDDITVELAENRLQLQGRVIGPQLVEVRTAGGK